MGSDKRETNWIYINLEKKWKNFFKVNFFLQNGLNNFVPNYFVFCYGK